MRQAYRIAGSARLRPCRIMDVRVDELIAKDVDHRNILSVPTPALDILRPGVHRVLEAQSAIATALYREALYAGLLHRGIRAGVSGELGMLARKIVHGQRRGERDHVAIHAGDLLDFVVRPILSREPAGAIASVAASREVV